MLSLLLLLCQLSVQSAKAEIKEEQAYVVTVRNAENGSPMKDVAVITTNGTPSLIVNEKTVTFAGTRVPRTMYTDEDGKVAFNGTFVTTPKIQATAPGFFVGYGTSMEDPMIDVWMHPLNSGAVAVIGPAGGSVYVPIVDEGLIYIEPVLHHGYVLLTIPPGALLVNHKVHMKPLQAHMYYRDSQHLVPGQFMLETWKMNGEIADNPWQLPITVEMKQWSYPESAMPNLLMGATTSSATVGDYGLQTSSTPTVSADGNTFVWSQQHNCLDSCIVCFWTPGPMPHDHRPKKPAVPPTPSAPIIDVVTSYDCDCSDGYISCGTVMVPAKSPGLETGSSTEFSSSFKSTLESQVGAGGMVTALAGIEAKIGISMEVSVGGKVSVNSKKVINPVSFDIGSTMANQCYSGPISACLYYTRFTVTIGGVPIGTTQVPTGTTYTMNLTSSHGCGSGAVTCPDAPPIVFNPRNCNLP